MTTAPARPTIEASATLSREHDPAYAGHIAVIGGGLAGLSAATDLATRGFRVTLIEKNAHLGGKMNVLSEADYHFDMGPTILTFPQVLKGIIERSGRTLSDYIELVELDPQWRCFYDDGTVLNLTANPTKFAQQLDQQFPNDKPGEGYLKFLEFSRRMLRLSNKVFFYKDLGGIPDLMREGVPNDPQVMKDAMAMRLYSTMARTAHKSIKEPHLAQMVEHFLQYVGSSPFLAPAILSLIASVQVDHGCWYAMGGTRMVARSLERILREYEAEGRVTIHTGAKVNTINHDPSDPSRVISVTLSNGETVTADAFVSNCDVQRTYRDLGQTPAAKEALGKVASKYKPACSGVVLYLGLDRQYDHLAHHNFLFSSNSESEFGDIYHKGIPAKDPTLYIAAPSRTDPDQAPPGGEALYILIHTAYKRPGQKWLGTGGLMESYRSIVMDKLKRCGKMPDIEQHIKVERHLTPDDIDTMYNAEGGAIYGLASHGKLAGGFKPRNRSKAYKNLYLAGGSANPGPGVPMVLMSGVTAARCVCQDFGVEEPETERYMDSLTTLTDA